MQVDAHAGGGSWNLCSWDREKALCCQVRVAIPEPLTCTIDSCDLDVESCDQDNKDEWGNPISARSLAVEDDEEGLSIIISSDSDLDKRGGGRESKWIADFGLPIIQLSLSHPTPSG